MVHSYPGLCFIVWEKRLELRAAKRGRGVPGVAVPGIVLTELTITAGSLPTSGPESSESNGRHSSGHFHNLCTHVCRGPSSECKHKAFIGITLQLMPLQWAVVQFTAAHGVPKES